MAIVSEALKIGRALHRKGLIREAREVFERVLQAQPEHADALHMLGVIFAQLGDSARSEDYIRRLLARKPDCADAHNNLGSLYWHQGRLGEALECYDRAVALRPDFPEARWNRAHVRLLEGNFAEGWEDYEWRWRCPELPRLAIAQPRWRGEPLAGKTILLHAEQGLGDTIQFIRYARIVPLAAGRVVAVCPKPLLPIVSSCEGIDRLVENVAHAGDFDCWAPLLSLPAILGIALDSIPRGGPYLAAAPELVEQWRERLQAHCGFRVGIAWQGNPRHRDDRHRSISLQYYSALARVPGACLISLQKGAGREQLTGETAEAANSVEQSAIIDLGPEMDTAAGPFMDTAAVMRNLDLVITSDTSIAHLAGALGVPVWVALAKVPDWRWLLEREDSPWYPSMRLFRQRAAGDWQDVFQRIASALAELTRQSGRLPREPAADMNRRRSIVIAISPGELIDRITILQIKAERFQDAEQAARVRAQLEALLACRDRWLQPSPDLRELTDQLRSVNEELWDAENGLRLSEQRHAFGAEFIELARSIYRNNDRRHQIKEAVNGLAGSEARDEKEYPQYEL